MARKWNAIAVGLALTILAAPGFAQAPQGLVALWSADGNAKDGVGTCNGVPSQGGAGFAAGKFGQAFRLEGNAYFQMPARTWGFSTKGTVTAWIKTDKLGGTVVSLHHGMIQNEMLLMVTDGKIGIFSHSRDSVYVARLSDSSVNTGNWIFVAGVLDGDKLPEGLRIYVTGVEEKGSTTSKGSFAPISDSTPRSVRIGWRTNLWPPESYAGLIDDVAIFNRALSPVEIAGIFRGGPLSAGTDTDGADDPLVIGKDPFAKPSKIPRVYVGDSNPRSRWDVEKKSLPAVLSLTDWEADNFMGIIRINVKEKRTVEFPSGPGRSAKDESAVRHVAITSISAFNHSPAGVFGAEQGKTSIAVTGRNSGVGKLFVRAYANADGQKAWAVGCWVVVVSKWESPPDPTIEIPRVDFAGRALRKSDEEPNSDNGHVSIPAGAPVAGARISLLLLDKDYNARGNYLEGDNLLTGPDGSFRVTATGLPRGKFEILIQLLGRKGMMNMQDLWPYQPYVIDLSPELARQGVLDVGIISMERVSLIDFAKRKQKFIVPKIAGGGPGGRPAPALATAPRGLVARWSADGNATDAVGGKGGALRGRVTFSSGFRGQAFNIDGKRGSGVLIGNPSNLRLQSFSILAWVKRADSGRATLDPELSPTGEIVGFGAGGYVFGMWDDGRLFLSKNLHSIVNTSRIRITDTRFHSVAVTKSGGKVVFYVDDGAESVPDYDPGFAFSSDLVIGATGDFRCPWYGQIDEVAIFNRTLSAEEISAVLHDGSGVPGPEDLDEEDSGEEPEIAFSSAGGIIYESYPKAWEDTRRVPPFAPTIAFKEPPQSSTKFNLDKPYVLTRLSTFHWYGGNGANSPGTIEIRKTDGGYSKSWPAAGEKDFTRSVTVYWVIEPNEVLEAGDYQVSVTPQNTWSFNARSRLEGIMKVEGYETVSDGKPKPSSSDPCSKPISRNATIIPGTFSDGRIESKNQSDFYTFSVDAGQNIVVSIQAEPGLKVRADLLDPKRTMRGRKPGRMSPGPATFKYKATAAGEYTIRVWVKNPQCKTGSYKVGVTLM